MNPIEDSFAAQQYELTVETLELNGFEQYEISNFARDSRYSRHNTAYWQQKSYLGIGPGAHSFQTHTRQSNVSNNAIYIKELKNQRLPATIEHLSPTDHYNEYILTGLRTKWGCQLDKLQEYTNQRFHEIQSTNLALFTENNWIVLNNNTLQLTNKGKLFADYISSELFIIE